MRKMWNPRAFKAQVSPHEFLQQVAQVSGGKFKITEQADPVEFLGWLLNRLHADMVSGGAANGRKRKKGGESVISRLFQGVVQVESQPLHRVEEPESSSAASVAAQAQREMNGATAAAAAAANGQIDDSGRAQFDPTLNVEKRDTPFFLLAMDLPTPPPSAQKPTTTATAPVSSPK